MLKSIKFNEICNDLDEEMNIKWRVNSMYVLVHVSFLGFFKASTQKLSKIVKFDNELVRVDKI